MQDTMIGTCNLCKEPKELQKVCHIIPDFFYRESELFHEYHNLIGLDLKELFETGKKKIVSSKNKTGFYDLYKFCKDCDGKIIGLYETYVRDFIYSKNLLKERKVTINSQKGYIEFVDVDYTKIKLLFLSILWRASLSDNEFFSEINLNSTIMEEIRDMILKKSPKKDIDFPIIVMYSSLDKKLSKDFLFKPINITINNKPLHIFAFGGFFIIYSNDIKDLPDSLIEYRIQENGIFKCLLISPGHIWKFIEKIYK